MRFLCTWAWLFVQAVAIVAVGFVVIVATMLAAILAWNLAIGNISVWWHQIAAILVILFVVTGYGAAVGRSS